MAILECMCNTDTGELEVKVDGEVLDMIKMVSIDMYDDEPHFMVSMCDEGGKGKVRKYTSLSAALAAQEENKLPEDELARFLHSRRLSK